MDIKSPVRQNALGRWQASRGFGVQNSGPTRYSYRLINSLDKPQEVAAPQHEVAALVCGVQTTLLEQKAL